MPRQQYSAQSPYVDTYQTNWYLLPITLREVLPDNTDTYQEISTKYQFRPDLMSYDLYGTPAYWWVFMIRNMNLIRDPIWDFQANVKIWVPTKTRIEGLMT